MREQCTADARAILLLLLVLLPLTFVKLKCSLKLRYFDFVFPHFRQVGLTCLLTFSLHVIRRH